MITTPRREPRSLYRAGERLVFLSNRNDMDVELLLADAKSGEILR